MYRGRLTVYRFALGGDAVASDARLHFRSADDYAAWRAGWRRRLQRLAARAAIGRTSERGNLSGAVADGRMVLVDDSFYAFGGPVRYYDHH